MGVHTVENMNRGSFSLVVLLAAVLALPAAVSAELIAQQPDNSSSNTFLTTNQISVHSPTFTASRNYSLGSEVTLINPEYTCSATAAGSLRFSANIPLGRNLSAYIFHDSATPTAHGINHNLWGDLPTCSGYIPGNGVMTDYVMPVTLPIASGGYYPDTGILNGQTYHIVFGETSGYPMEISFKTDSNDNIFYQLYDDATSSPATTTPETLDPVIIIPGILGSAEHNGVWEIDPILHSYDDLIATLDANDYTLGVDLFTFPYDWRKSNVDTAVLLKQKIDEVKALCVCDKVDLVAHSMGGLAARQYIQSATYEHDVDQLIFLGTPHLGAPKAYLMWEGGEFGPGFQALMLGALIKHEAKEHGYGDVYTYMKSHPILSVRELLPVYNYIFDNNSLRQYPNEYPTNTFLEQLRDNIQSLSESGVKITNIVGSLPANETIVGLNVTAASPNALVWEHGVPTTIILGSGDGTVPLASANLPGVAPAMSTTDHLSLAFLAQADVFGALTGEQPVTVVNNLQRVDAKFLILKLLSPVDILVIGPDGKRIGRGANNEELNEIPAAFYTGFNTDTEFITIPDPLSGEYRVIVKGTGVGGKYTVESDFLTSTTNSSVSFTGSTTPGQITELKLFVNGTSPTNNEIKPVDVVPPTLEITNPKSQDYERSQALQIQVSATDTSGILSLVTQLGTTTVPNIGTVDTFYLKLGKHTAFASSTDNVGNVATSSRDFRIIATPDSTIADIERAYSLGWMTKAVRDTLVKRLQAAIKISKIVVKATNGKPQSEKVQKTVDKILAAAMLIELQKLKGKGLNDQAYLVLKEDLAWLISN